MENHTPAKKGKWKTALMIILPLLAGIAIIYLLNRPKKKKGAEKATDAVKNSVASNPAKAIDPAQFPLKPGSKGPLVTALQNALIAAYGTEVLPKYGADGDWGSETTKALSKINVTSIKSQVDYDAAIRKLQSVSSIIVNSARADDLVNKWKANTALLTMTTGKQAFLWGVSIDSYGAVVPNDVDMMLAQGYKYNREDYQLQEATKNGYVIINVTRGPKAGLKKVLASEITVG